MISLALAGKPNAGKSTFFKAATQAEVDVANYPFTTIDPNRGVAYVRTTCPCLELDERCENDHCRNGKRYIPVELIDVAGLVPGAHEGRGLGNQFLDALSTADVIINVVDASGGTNEEGEPVDIGSHDPRRDIDFVESEMEQWMTGIIKRNWDTVERQSRSPGFDIDEAITEMLIDLGASQSDIATIIREMSYPAGPQEWTDDLLTELAQSLRKRTKPFVIAANKADIAPDTLLDQLLSNDREIVPTTAEGELALRQGADAGILAYDPGDESFEIIGEITGKQRSGLERIAEVMDDWGGTGVQRVLDNSAFNVLGLIPVFPVQNENRWTDGQDNILPDAFLMEVGSTPRDLAATIHTDIEEGYLHAVDARSKRRIADDYQLASGDVIKIVSTAT